MSLRFGCILIGAATMAISLSSCALIFMGSKINYAALYDPYASTGDRVDCPVRVIFSLTVLDCPPTVGMIAGAFDAGNLQHASDLANTLERHSTVKGTPLLGGDFAAIRGKIRAAQYIADGDAALKGNSYAIARGDFESALSLSSPANPEPRAQDGLCIAEYQGGAAIGVSLGEQLKTCQQALKGPHSTIPPNTIDLISKQLATQYTDRITMAISNSNVATADAALAGYVQLPTHNPDQAAIWREQIVKLKAVALKQADEARALAMKDAIIRLGKRYPGVHGMTPGEFVSLISLTEVNAFGAPVFSGGRIDGNVLTLYTTVAQIAEGIVNNAAPYDQINDAFVAWCGCDGRTEIVYNAFGVRTGLAQIRLQDDGSSGPVLGMFVPTAE